MTTSTKLWLGYGTLMTVLVVSVLAMLARVSSVQSALEEQVNVARPRLGTTRQLEIHLLRYVLGLRNFVHQSDPEARVEAKAASGEVDRDLAAYREFANTDRRRQLVTAFATRWEEVKAHGQTMIEAKEKQQQPALEDLTKLRTLRVGLERFLNEQMETEALDAFNARKEMTFRNLRAITGFALTLLFAGVVIAVVTSVAVGRAVLESERAIAEQGERWRTTLASIGDGVVTTDTEGRITNLNPVAASLTGWTSSDAVGQPLDAVFRIVNEETRATVESPTARALKEGIIVGLANHTILIARDGTERFIDDSAAPIRCKDGEIVGSVLIFRDISDHRRAEVAMARLAALVESSIDAIVGKNLAGIVTHWNAGAERVFGYAASEMIGQSILRIIPADRHDEETRILAQLRRGEAVDHFETVRVRKGGDPVHISVAVSPIKDAAGRVIGASKVARDITERKRTDEALRAAKEAAETANQSKDRFLAVLSHELRTPLSPVLMIVGALEKDAELRPDVREDMAMIKRNIELETKLIDDLLDLSRITSGKVELKSEPVDLNEVVRHVCDICRPQIAEQQVQLQMDLDQEVFVISADPARLRQVFWNVLKNAIKFTPAQGMVRVSTARLASGRCEVRVQDSGIGIPPEVLPRIFNAFEQGEAHITRQFGGLGLGLAISRALVELHGGTIRAESEGQGKGATFIVELPGQAASLAPVAPASEVREVTGTPQIRLLLVEDHADTARTLVRLLRAAGFAVVAAADVASAMATAEREPFDVVVSDLGLPDGDGYELIRAIRARRSVPSIALSGYGMDEDIRRSHEAGFTEHLVKPVDVPQLIAAIRRVIETRE